MLRLRFGGWFQCRLATDPDPADEPRGVSGSIKALPGEPDLDRIIRLQPPVFRRSHTRQVGVEVREVRLDGELLRHHPLAGAAVDLLGDPVFKGENGVPEGRLGANIDLDRPWTAEFWMGGWDPDAMCAFMQGYLSVPTR
jgi:hypothetical protein